MLGAVGGIAGTALPILGAGIGLYQTISGAKDKADSKRALDNYERQQLTNVADGLQVSTLGSDLQRQEQSRLASGQIEGLRGGGTRALLGGLGRVETGNQNVMAQTGASLDQQQKDIDQMYAQDQARIRQMQENREIGDISGLSSQYNSGKQDMNMGMGNMLRGLGSAYGGMYGMNTAEKNNVATNGYTTSGDGLNLTNPAMQSEASLQKNYINNDMFTNPNAFNPFRFNPYNSFQGGNNGNYNVG